MTGKLAKAVPQRPWKRAIELHGRKMEIHGKNDPATVVQPD